VSLVWAAADARQQAQRSAAAAICNRQCEDRIFMGVMDSPYYSVVRYLS
jgi:hypothetical protein